MSSTWFGPVCICMCAVGTDRALWVDGTLLYGPGSRPRGTGACFLAQCHWCMCFQAVGRDFHASHACQMQGHSRFSTHHQLAIGPLFFCCRTSYICRRQQLDRAFLALHAHIRACHCYVGLAFLQHGLPTQMLLNLLILHSALPGLVMYILCDACSAQKACTH